MQDDIVLTMRGICKYFPGVKALEHVVVYGQQTEPVPDGALRDGLFLHRDLPGSVHMAYCLLDAPGKGPVFEDIQMELFQDLLQVIPVVSRYTD